MAMTHPSRKVEVNTNRVYGFIVIRGWRAVGNAKAAGVLDSTALTTLNLSMDRAPIVDLSHGRWEIARYLILHYVRGKTAEWFHQIN